ncbi:hypothetical protein SAMN02745229_00770 [Butyrivibrio fibrisolvens DSM 3071]|uniref:Peptidase propeptide and YPEB domain-containing protein n=1 Tax=Butyrivibrio fibrisolvens DSM 3071 TaxID=1121131 RepID=A0A1M5UWH6_BUTFI|nr:hypothetical protein [Butyrivibrio fibrisolvens]SHH67325.1 hypothetical protein SAMN02745229_00770 [Butyrivibrio fibrisolvens DSM 3071]
MKKKIVFLILSCSMLFVGCANNMPIDNSPASDMDDGHSNMQSNDSTAVTVTIPTKYQNIDGKVTFDGEISYGSLDNLCCYSASLQKIDASLVEEDLLKEEKEYDSYSDTFDDEYGNSIDCTSYINVYDGFYLSSGPVSSNFSYSRGNSNFSYYAAAFRIEKKFDDYNADKFSTQEDLPFESRQEAYSQIGDFLKALGFDSDFEYVSYSLDHSTLQNEEVHYDMNGNIDPSENKDQWTQEDDCYYVALRQIFNGVPIYYPYVSTFVNEDVENYPINAMVNENGIFSLNIDQVFEFADEEKIDSVVEFDTVFDAVSDKFNDILDDSTYVFDLAELVYYVDLSSNNGIYEVYPVWIIKGNETSGDSETEIQVFVDARTGDEIIPWTQEL